MDFFIGVFVGGLMVGGIALAKMMANKAAAAAAPSTYLTGGRLRGKGRVVVPAEPIEIDPLTGHGESM